MCLQQQLKKYQGFKRQRQKQLFQIKEQIQRKVEEESKFSLKIQNHKVNQIHKNQQQIQNKLKKQQDLIVQLKKNQDIWVSLYDELNRALMAAGDLVHYSGYIEAQINEILGEGTVAAFLQKAEKEQQDDMIERIKKKSNRDKKIEIQQNLNEDFHKNDKNYEDKVI